MNRPHTPGSDLTRAWLRERFPPESFERGAVLIENTFMQTGADGTRPLVAYVHEGLVRGMWNRAKIAPTNRATALVAGDGRWIGADAFQFGENQLRFRALTATAASVVPLASLRDEAPRAVVVDALESVARDWCTNVTVLSLRRESLERRTLLLLHDLSRMHPRPEIEVRQHDLADLLGLARQTLQPVLRRLADAGLIGLGYGEIVVADPQRLYAELRRKSATPTVHRPLGVPRRRRPSRPR